jgi:hypothetical protein
MRNATKKPEITGQRISAVVTSTALDSCCRVEVEVELDAMVAERAVDSVG